MKLSRQYFPAFAQSQPLGQRQQHILRRQPDRSSCLNAEVFSYAIFFKCFQCTVFQQHSRLSLIRRTQRQAQQCRRPIEQAPHTGSSQPRRLLQQLPIHPPFRLAEHRFQQVVALRQVMAGCESGNARLSRHFISQNEGEIFEMPNAIHLPVFKTKHLAAPNLPIAAQARSIPYQPQNRRIGRQFGMLRQRRREMRLVMLIPEHRNLPFPGQYLAQPGGIIIRVQVGQHRLRPGRKQAEQMPQRPLETAFCIEILKIAEVLTEVIIALMAQSESAFQHGAHSQHSTRSSLPSRQDEGWGQSTRAPQNDALM